MIVTVDKAKTNTNPTKYTIIAVDEYKTNTIEINASVTSIVCQKGLHYWMVLTLVAHATLPPSLATSALG